MIRLKQAVGRLTIAATVAMILAGSPLTPTFAREKIVGLDSFSIQCRALQDESDDLIAEYGRPGTTLDRKEEILTELRNLGMTWNQIGCRKVFGQFTPIPTPPPYRR